MSEYRIEALVCHPWFGSEWVTVEGVNDKDIIGTVWDYNYAYDVPIQYPGMKVWVNYPKSWVRQSARSIG